MLEMALLLPEEPSKDDKDIKEQLPEIWQLNKVGAGGFFAINSGDEQTT
jgi:hypothetical protein